MRTTLDLTRSLTDDTFVSDSDLIGFDHPRDIVHDPVLTLARKRQLLAYWASDIHAVAGMPALRSYHFGPAVSIDDLRDALCQLDEMVDLPAVAAGSSSSVAA